MIYRSLLGGAKLTIDTKSSLSGRDDYGPARDQYQAFIASLGKGNMTLRNRINRISRKAKTLISAGIVATVAACGGGGGGDGTVDSAPGTGPSGSLSQARFEQLVAAGATPNERALITNALVAFAVYEDSLLTAQQLQAAINAFVANPSEDTLVAARSAWLASREPYGQSEVYRFREGPIDRLQPSGGGEGSINAWPLNEARIDYVSEVDGESGAGTPVSTIASNIVADADNFPTITPQMLRDLNELDGDEGNVFTGYHAIEFLLWGQDLNADGSSGLAGRDNSAGFRPFTDYLPEGAGCTNGNCTRRAQYLQAAAQGLVEDLLAVVNEWNPDTGAHYASYTAGGNPSLSLILEAMGRLSFGELAGERMNIALLANSQEDEHSCFADNTHRDIVTNALGVKNAYLGSYTRVDGMVLDGVGIDELVSPDLAARLLAALNATEASAASIDARARAGVPFDNQIQEGPNEANITATINNLIAQTRLIEEAIVALGLTTGDLDQDTEEFQL